MGEKKHLNFLPVLVALILFRISACIRCSYLNNDGNIPHDHRDSDIQDSVWARHHQILYVICSQTAAVRLLPWTCRVCRAGAPWPPCWSLHISATSSLHPVGRCTPPGTHRHTLMRRSRKDLTSGHVLSTTLVILTRWDRMRCVLCFSTINVVTHVWLGITEKKHLVDLTVVLLVQHNTKRWVCPVMQSALIVVRGAGIFNAAQEAELNELTMYSLMRPWPLSGGLQETSTFPSSPWSHDSCRFLGGSGTVGHTDTLSWSCLKATYATHIWRGKQNVVHLWSFFQNYRKGDCPCNAPHPRLIFWSGYLYHLFNAFTTLFDRTWTMTMRM